MSRVAQIGYLNTLPFFYQWSEKDFPLIKGTPRELADLAKKGDVLAGPLPIPSLWEMESEFEPLGNWGIAAQKSSGSVLVSSQKPFSSLDEITVGVTPDSLASVALCEILINQKYGHQVTLKRGFQEDDKAQLVIGDQALLMGLSTPSPLRPYVTDLATEWWEWQKLPFVFARWAVKKNISPHLKNRLESCLRDSFEEGIKNIGTIASSVSGSLGISEEKISRYLNEFIFKLGPTEEKSMALFRERVEKQKTLLPL